MNNPPSVLQPIKLVKYNNKTHVAAVQVADEKTWYPHKYNAFDPDCQTFDDVMESIDQYIHQDKSTPAFEAEKYIIFQRLQPFLYTINKYAGMIKETEWIHLAATCIINFNPIEYIMSVINTYRSVHNMGKFPSRPEDNELCWLCCQVNNLSSMITLLQLGSWPYEDWKERLDEDSLLQILNKICPKNEAHPDNPRNLVYALLRNDPDLALYLINEGIQVDVWNNFPMKIVMSHPPLKSNKELVKALFDGGAKIPMYIQQLHKSQIYSQPPKAIIEPITRVSRSSSSQNSQISGSSKSKQPTSTTTLPTITPPALPSDESSTSTPVTRTSNVLSTSVVNLWGEGGWGDDTFLKPATQSIF